MEPDYSQSELRILAQMMATTQPRKLAQGSLRTCSFIAFAYGYGDILPALALAGTSNRTNAMALNFAMIYGGRHGTP